MDFMKAISKNKDHYGKFEDEKSPRDDTKDLYFEKTDKVGGSKRDVPVSMKKRNSSRRKSSVRSPQDGILEHSNPITNIPNAVKNYLMVQKQKSDAYHDSTSEISIETTHRDLESQRVYRIFLVCWFLHAVLGILTLIIDYSNWSANPFSYYYVMVMTFKWIVTAVMTLLFSFFLYLLFRIIKPKVKSNFEEYVGAMYSMTSSLVIILAIPFGFKALYTSEDTPFMTLLFIQIEIVLDILICAQVVYNIIFSKESTTFEFESDQEKGITEILSKDNLDKLQQEIINAYENNEVLKFERGHSKQESSSPERTQTDNTEVRNRRHEDDDKNSFFPISELDGEKNLSFENNSSIRHNVTNSRSSRQNRNNSNIERRHTGGGQANDQIEIVVSQLEKSQSEQTSLELFKHRNSANLNNSSKYGNIKCSQQLLNEMPHVKIQEKDEENDEEPSQSISMKDSMSNK